MNDLPKTAHELAAFWSWTETFIGFTLSGGRVVWEDAEYTPRSDRVKIARIVPVGHKLRVIKRYIDPNTSITLVPGVAK